MASMISMTPSKKWKLTPDDQFQFRSAVLVFAIALITCPSRSGAGRAKHREVLEELRSSLLSGYNRHFAPLEDSHHLVPVSVGMMPLAILDLNSAQQVLITMVYIITVWNDPDLAWNTTKVGAPGEGVDSITLDPGDIWTPQLMIVNKADGSQVLQDYDVTIVSFDGTVQGHLALKLETTCQIDVTRYPFDTQSCKVLLAPMWGYNLNLTFQQVNLSFGEYFEVSGEWELKPILAETKMIELSESIRHPVVQFQLVLERRWIFYLLTVIFPMLLFSFTGAFGFLLPPQCGEKVSFQVAILVSLSVYLSFINDAMPKTSQYYSRLAMYVDLLLAQSCLAFLATLIVLGGHFHLEKVDQEDRDKRAYAKEPGNQIISRQDDTEGTTEWLRVKSRGREIIMKAKQCIRRWYCCCCCVPPQTLDRFFFFVFFAVAVGSPLVLVI